MSSHSTIMPKANTTIAYTDGACKGNPGAGGWGAYLIFADGSRQELYAGDANTTNNRMEMMATIQAIIHATKKSPQDKLELWTDSSYVKNGITQWIDGWKKKGWKTASKKPVKNQDLWQQLDQLNQGHNVDWHWIKGHAGHEGNEKADELANLGVIQPDGNFSSSESSLKSNLTSGSMNESSTHTKPQSLKKNFADTASPADDWMTTDILGFDSFDDLDNLDDLASFDNSDSYDDYHNNPNSDGGGNDSEREREHSHNLTTDMSNDTNTDSHISTQKTTQTIQENQPMTTTYPQDNNQNTSQNANPSINQQPPTEQLPEFDGDTSRANPYFRPLLPKPINQGRKNRQLIMDTETTGFEFNNGDRIIEVGIVEMVGRKFTGEKLHVYINPNRHEPMSEETIRVHGITDAFLADKPTFDKVAKQVYDFMLGAEIIAHNASFDMNFLNMEFARVGLGDFASKVKVTDSLAIAKNQYPGQRNSLDALVRRLNVGKQDRTFHGALLDSEILAEVYLAMTGGQVSLAIDDDSSAGGDIQHAQFAKMANLLVSSSINDDAHNEWLATISAKFPAVNEVWSSSNTSV